jgi:hypothetical protein
VISFRYHVVSLVAVLLALAAGVALGSGPLATGAPGPADDTGDQTNARLEAQVSALQAGNTSSDAFARSVAPGLLRGRLRGRVVTLVVLPTAAKADVAALDRLVTVAGGTTGGTLRVSGRLVDVGNKQLVDELGTRLEGRARGLRVPAAAGPYERIGALLGRAIGTTREGGARVDADATTILGALDAAGLVSAERRPTRRADLVLVVDGPGPAGSSTGRAAAGTVAASVAAAVDAGTAGVVLAGPDASARDGGAVAAVRADPDAAGDVSTVDILGRGAGQVVTVLALAEQAAGRSGQYGAVDAADGVVPALRG